MVAWSSVAFRRVPFSYYRNLPVILKPKVTCCKGLNLVQVRHCKSSGHIFRIVPSYFQWNKFKDMLHFYVILWLIPTLGLVLYVNIFIGPATLKEIPEGYQPKPWEYYSHPISRFIAKYMVEEPQKTYEKMCFALFYESERQLVREIERKVKYLIADRRDYQSWYYTPVMTKYAMREAKSREDYKYKMPGGSEPISG